VKAASVIKYDHLKGQLSPFFL